ncbi:MAG: ketoacyl-ACP synthase III [Flavobacteriaceae bacterium]|nr:ketoacyl-ACP synthase III [Flavobacteriaceae bacterium]
MAYLQEIEYYLPENILSNKDINKQHPEWSVDKISSKTGIYNRHVSKNNEFASDLGYMAAEKLFETHKVNRHKIDYLIFCTQSPDFLLPTTACIIQDRLELNKSIGAIDINMGCSGFIYGLSYAKGLISSGQAKTILLITSETYTKYIHDIDKTNKTIFGDGASASIISKETNNSLTGVIKNFDFYTDGGGYDKLIVKNSGIRFHNAEGVDKIDENGLIRNNNYLYMDGKSIFEFTSFKVPPIFKKVLEKNNVEIEEIDLFIFHQANAFMMQFIRKRCKIPQDKFFVYLEDCANTVSSTIPIALNEAIKQNKIRKGNKVLLMGYGVGLSIAGTILEY